MLDRQQNDETLNLEGIARGFLEQCYNCGRSWPSAVRFSRPRRIMARDYLARLHRSRAKGSVGENMTEYPTVLDVHTVYMKPFPPFLREAMSCST